MTDAMLRLARAVYPDHDWSDIYGLIVGQGEAIFDPANNADQFCDVLAWLLSDKELAASVCRTHVGWFDSEDCAHYIDHDGTASGIRRAVVEAAKKVLQ